MDEIIGQSIGSYQVLEQIGKGGMAIVYRAHDADNDTDVAIKVIRTEQFAPVVLEKALKRFKREAEVLSKLTHPHIVKIIAYGEHDGRPYLVMPILSGGSLRDKMAGKPLAWKNAAKIMIPIAKALGYAHAQGVIHRDVKSSNILFTSSGEPMLTDFGIVKNLDEEATSELTGSSATVGTPEYIAPEQLSNKNIDHRVDIYSLGVVFYEMVTGHTPFSADTPWELLLKHKVEPVTRPQRINHSIPNRVDKVICKALEKKPENRYRNMDALVRDLTKVMTPNQATVVRERKRTSPFGIISILVSILNFFIGVIWAGYFLLMAGMGNTANYWELVMSDILFVLCIFMGFGGVISGVVGLARKEPKRGLAILGLCFGLIISTIVCVLNVIWWMFLR